MPTVFESGVMASLWLDRINDRLATCDYHIERIPQLLLMLGLTRCDVSQKTS
jgi:hypothetical protein